MLLINQKNIVVIEKVLSKKTGWFDKYEYDNGISTTKPFKKANKKNLLLWWEKFKLHDIYNYNYYIVGGFLNKQKTKDVDIVVIGDIKKDLYSILTLAKKIGFEYNILIDIFWCDGFYDHTNYKPIKKIKNFSKLKITKRNKTIIYNYGGKEILKGLFETNHKQPPKDYYKIKNYKNKYIKIQDYINGTRN